MRSNPGRIFPTGPLPATILEEPEDLLEELRGLEEMDEADEPEAFARSHAVSAEVPLLSEAPFGFVFAIATGTAWERISRRGCPPASQAVGP